MAFTDVEIARYAGLIEKLIWAKRRPPLHLRDKVREGQRIGGPRLNCFSCGRCFPIPRGQIEQSIAKTRYVKSRDVWQVFWKRADMKWHRYLPRPEVKSLGGFLKLVNEDANGCFWG